MASPKQPEPTVIDLVMAAWWAEQIKPSRQRNLTPEQRKDRAEALRVLRRSRARDPNLVSRSAVVAVQRAASFAARGRDKKGA